MIRLANKYDKTEIIQMMQAFRKESQIDQYGDLENTEYWDRLLSSIFAGQGFVYIDSGKGLIMGCIFPSIWCDKTFGLHELAWYVMPDHRNTTVGARLFHAYLQEANNLKQSGRIKYYIMSKLANSPELKYEKYGFKKLDENWIQ